MNERKRLGERRDGVGVHLDVERLVDTRLLVQANSGGGKSWCLRRILEQTHGCLQHLVIDPEGEFASLRERYDYILAAKHGADTAADPRSGRLLAERLLELGVSAILDIYELRAHDRIRFVRQFLEALVDAPKKLWHPALVVVDEAHVYCPQQGEAESASAVIDLATRGRKRGFCAVLATQRLSKLHKDAAAELNNKLIGRTGLDVDMKRAADELGFSKDKFYSLRELHAGSFFAFGPAISQAVVEVKVGPVRTTHPKAGARLTFTAPPPTAKVKALLPKLKDLPAETEQRQKTVAELQARVRELERGAPVRTDERIVTKVEKVNVDVVSPESRKMLKRLAAALEALDKKMPTLGDVGRLVKVLNKSVGFDAVIERPTKFAAGSSAVGEVQAGMARRADERAARATYVSPFEYKLKTVQPAASYDPTLDGKPALKAGERAMLNALAAKHPARLTRSQVATLSRLRPKGHTLRTYMSRLTTGGYIGKDANGLIALTPKGLAAAGAVEKNPMLPEEIRAMWRATMKKGARELFNAVVDAYPQGVPRDELAQRVGLEPTGHTLRTYLSHLRSNGLVTTDSGVVTAAAEVMG